MTFIDETPKTKRTEFKRTQFLALNEGANVIRIVQPKPVKKWAHFIGTAYVECLGFEDCPVCRNNKQLQMEYPQDYYKQSGYNPSRRRYFVNVIERTMGKICPQCNEDYKGNIPAICPKCQYVLAPVPMKPINKIKVLAGGPTLFEEDLNALDKAVVNPTTGEPLGIMAYDITLVVKGAGKERSITAIPNQAADLDFDTSGLELFDLERAIVKLGPSEMLDLQHGVSLKDIFSARKANSNADAVIDEPKSVISEDTKATLQSQMESLFENKG